MEPFNIAVSKFIENMKQYDYNMIHYGHESSEVDCEHFSAITNKELPPPHEGAMMKEHPAYTQLFCNRVSDRLHKVKQPGDMVLCFYGISHQAAVKEHMDLKIVEPSIGYLLECVFAPYKGFTSYSQMHYYNGLYQQMLQPSWWDAVIPNAFTVNEFEFCDDKEDYFVYLGRISQDKGIHLAIQITEKLGKKLVIAGPGSLQDLGYASIPAHVECVGYVNVEQRKELLKKASCLIAATHYIEPFGNIVVEAMLSGTPVITTDWGGFVDTVQQGVTGYRCKDFKTFLEAGNNIKNINPRACREWAESKFSDEVVHKQFDTWLQKLKHMDFYHV
jgi:glycosyltransferase involved in cell wall biosynthesis